MMAPSQQNPYCYELLGRLAQGGMASVYLARMSTSTGASRLVAVKRLHKEYATDKNFVARLSHEARVSSQLRHPNVAGTVEFAPVEGSLSLVLDFVEGESLAALIKHAEELGESIPPSFAVTMMSGILRGLQAAHVARIVHRDLSPKTILIGVDGDARVVDWGVANARDAIELTGERPWKSAYMPPEQLLGRPVSPQFDLYAAGVILWELLAGERFYESPESNAMSPGVLSKAVERPSAFNPAIPTDLDAVVMRAVARNEQDRFESADEFARALRPWHGENEDAVGAWVSRLAANRLASMRRLLDRAAEGERAWIESSVASIAGVERPTRSSSRPISSRPVSSRPVSSRPISSPPMAGLPLEPQNPNERTVVMPYSYTPPAAPKTKAAVWLEWSETKLRGMPPALVACGLAALIACAIAGVMMKSEPDLEQPALTSPATLSDPASMPPPPAPTPEPVLPPVLTAEPTANVVVVPMQSAAPAESAAPVKTSTLRMPRRPPPPPPALDRDDVPIPVTPTRQPRFDMPKASTDTAPKASADAPKAPSSNRDYR